MIRLRRHTDGRVALKFTQSRRVSAEPQWCVVNGPGGVFWASDTVVSNPGWSELLVAELPEPDHWTDCVGPDGEDAITPQWEVSGGPLITAWIDGVETDDNGLEEDLDHIRSGALKTLAAVAACEQYRAQRETT